jgi:hypothetical protein
MGDNRWRDESEWPLKRTTYTKVFLHGRGAANSSFGDGSLSLAAPTSDDAADRTPPIRFRLAVEPPWVWLRASSIKVKSSNARMCSYIPGSRSPSRWKS